MTLSLGCSQPRVGLLTKLPWRVHSSPPSWPPSTRVLRPPPPLSLFMSWRRGRGPESGTAAPTTPSPSSATLPGSPFGPRRPPAGLASFRLLIRGKKEHRVVGLSSPDRGGRMGPREEADGEGSSSGGLDPEAPSSSDDRDSFRSGLYLGLGGRRSMAGVRRRLQPSLAPLPVRARGPGRGHPQALSLIGPLWPRDLKGPGKEAGQWLQFLWLPQVRHKQFPAPSPPSVEPLLWLRAEQAGPRAAWLLPKGGERRGETNPEDSADSQAPRG